MTVDVLAVCGWIAAIGGAAAIIWKVFTPLLKMSKRVDALERHEKRDLERFEKIDDNFSQTRKADKAMYKAVLAILNHMIDGNSTEGMKQARMALSEHIIDN